MNQYGDEDKFREFNQFVTMLTNLKSRSKHNLQDFYVEDDILITRNGDINCNRVNMLGEPNEIVGSFMFSKETGELLRWWPV